MTKIPFTVLPEPLLQRFYRSFLGVGKILENNVFPNFSLTLKQGRIEIPAQKYLTYCFLNNLFSSGIIFLLLFFLLSSIEDFKYNPLLIAFFSSLFMYVFLFFQQIAYPRLNIKKRVDNIERNILPALQNVLVQLKSGIPLFDVTVNIAASNYGEVSKEFMVVVKKINGGVHQVEAFEKMALENPSAIFRSSIWQMVNGMKTGAELSVVLREIMINLSEEQVLQIEQYGAVLSPLTMFYMIGAVILPALGVNFLIVISAFMDLGVEPTQVVFWGVYGLLIFFQFTFLNIIRSKRPSLLT